MTDIQAWQRKVRRLLRERRAILLAHYYQRDEIQEIADLRGDSLALSIEAARTDAPVIVFAGVHFMAESAAIISPERTVLLPRPDAGCALADWITAAQLQKVREADPDLLVVTYINSSAAVKALSDICCTSANAVKVVESLSEQQVIMVPDRNLAGYVARFTTKEILPWDGFCLVHERFTRKDIQTARSRHPGAEVLVHPECRPEVIDAADQVFSTSGMIRHICGSKNEEFIIGTETGILHQISLKCPKKNCYPLSSRAICVNMKKTDLEKVHAALDRMAPRVRVPERIAIPARRAIERMLALP